MAHTSVLSRIFTSSVMEKQGRFYFSIYLTEPEIRNVPNYLLVSRCRNVRKACLFEDLLERSHPLAFFKEETHSFSKAA